ncbi:MAG TPA: TetR/AcrR family transcriptional regulator [Solirubrobacterales bacterium]|nr:TetR/AcrR family transcriptional regulator [Solirubrobacterales bacterium]
MGSGHGLLSESERDRIIGATTDLCWEVGFEQMSEVEIAARAGVPEESFFLHFESKEAAAQAAIETVLAAVVEIMGRLFSPDRSEAESYLYGIDSILELMEAEPAFAHVSYTAARQMMPPALKARLDSGSNLLAAMLDRLREQAPDGRQPPLTARAALGGAEAVVRREISRGSTGSLRRLVPDFVYAATVPFLGQREALRYARLAEARTPDPPLD